MESKNKVLVIGIDALDPQIIDRLTEEGKLPNFKELESYAKLETTIPPETPVAWSAASTGSNPGRYGIFDFIDRDPQSYLPRLNLAIEKPGIMKTEYISTMRGVPFWKILNDNNILTTVIRWPVTFPAEKIKGRMLSGLGVVDIKGMLNSYSFYTDKEPLEDAEGKEKVITVSVENSMIETYISGPLTRKGGQITDVRFPIKIELGEDGIVMEINEKKHAIRTNQWSEMIKIKFKLGMFAEVHGILKFYLLSVKPFRMYANSVQIDPENQAVKITHPVEYGKELAEKIGLFHTLGMPEDTKAVTENVLDKSVFLEQIKQIEEERKRVFYYEFERFREGALVFVFDAGDRLKHIFWKNKTNRTENEDWTIPKEIEDYYVEKDRFIGDVLSKLDERTKLIIFSDHGFNDFTKQVNINSWLIKEGYMKTKNADIGDSTLFEFVDWGATKAYSLGFTSIYLNMKGREGRGTVSPEEKEELIKEIVSKLNSLEDNRRGVFTNIYRSTEIYNGAYMHLAPDIVLGFSPGYRMSWKSAIGGLDAEIIFDNESKWCGDHLIDRSHVPGVLFANFKINKQDANIMDIAPTILKLFSIKIPQSMDGESLI